MSDDLRRAGLAVPVVGIMPCPSFAGLPAATTRLRASKGSVHVQLNPECSPPRPKHVLQLKLHWLPLQCLLSAETPILCRAATMSSMTAPCLRTSLPQESCVRSNASICYLSVHNLKA